jgi:hypothetical protein
MGEENVLVERDTQDELDDQESMRSRMTGMS